MSRIFGLASALLTFGLVSGCLDPNLVTELDTDENHAPFLDEMSPPPIFRPRPVLVGENCLPESFGGTLDDFDEDILTVHWNLIVQRTGQANGATVTLDEFDLPPLPDPGAEGQHYGFKPLELSFTRLVAIFDVSGLEEESQKEGQLLELRVSDRGFPAGQEEPPAGAGFAFFSWALKLTFDPDGC
jgi:hypothetical protein